MAKEREYSVIQKKIIIEICSKCKLSECSSGPWGAKCSALIQLLEIDDIDEILGYE